MAGKLGTFPSLQMSRNVTEADVQYTTVNDDDPTVTFTNSVISSVERTGEGVVKVTLKDKYNTIMPTVSVVHATLTTEAKISAMVQGQSATNYVEITTDIQDGTPVADDLPGAVVNLHLKLSNGFS